MVGFSIALAGGLLGVVASARFLARVAGAQPFEGRGGPPSSADTRGARVARAIEAFRRSGCDPKAVEEALSGSRPVECALAEVNEALSEIDFRLSNGRDAARGGVRLALTAGLLGGVLELSAGSGEAWILASGAALGGLGGALWGSELLRRGDAAAKAARGAWDRLAGELERQLRRVASARESPGP